MACCEKCWAEAGKRHMSNPHKSKSDHYYDVMHEVEDEGKACTPKEKAGHFWDKKNQRDNRTPMTSKDFILRLKQYMTDGRYGDCVGESKAINGRKLEFSGSPKITVIISDGGLDKLDEGGD